MGGGTFSSGITVKNFIENNQLENNMVHSNINNYSSIPSYILLNTTLTDKSKKIITGDYLSLKFLMYDAYDNKIEDITKYYSPINIKVVMSETNNKNDYDDNNEQKKIFNIVGNICYFSNGKIT